VERRLAAILATDVVGYTRLMEEDEEGTFGALKTRRKMLFEPAVRQHGGSTVKLMGDGALMEFPSIVAALQCAIAMQTLNERENEPLPEARRIRLRMGVDIGDVLIDEGDIFGTAVNIASRLQALAQPGGICISGAAMEQAQGRIGAAFRHRGQQALRNIAEPVAVYEVDSGGLPQPTATIHRPPARAIPGRPSLAVLPFQNLGGEGVQQYFADGITRDLITELSRFRSLFVISANSSFRFRGTDRNQASIGRELGVRYLGDGSVQRVGGQLRVTAELVDAQSGEQLWADRYSHDVEDPTAVQDWLAHNIASRLHNRLEHAELDIVKRKPPSGLASYDLWLQAAELHDSTEPEAYARARELYRRAIAADPGFARAYASLAELAYMQSALSNWGRPGKDDCAEAAEYARKAVALDDQDAAGHAVMGWVHMVRHDFAKARRHWDLAAALNPNDADLMMWRASALAFLGEPEQGAETAQMAMRLNPLHPDWYLSDYAVVLFFCRRFEEMLSIYDIIPELFPHTPGWRAAALAHLGRGAEAGERAAVFARRIATIWSGPSDATPQDYGRWFAGCIPLRRPQEREIMESGLRLAGLLD
jgi:TolB-like protein/class 3 adenylate cyclase